MKRSKIGAALVVLGSGAIAFTLMACYGVAPDNDCPACDPAEAGADANPDNRK